MEHSEKFNEEAAIKVISEMIEATRNDVQDNSFFYLLWGFLVFAASLLEYCLLTLFHYPSHYIGWPILMGIGMIISFVFIAKKFGRSDSRTYIGSFFKYFFIAWSLSLLLLLAFLIPNNNQLVQPIILTMYALATFVSGGILRFRPLIWGGIIAWAAAVASFFSPFDIQLLITAATVVVAYLVPGFLLKRRNRSQITVN
jgi:hypothetical protein